MPHSADGSFLISHFKMSRDANTAVIYSSLLRCQFRKGLPRCQIPWVILLFLRPGCLAMPHPVSTLVPNNAFVGRVVSRCQFREQPAPPKAPCQGAGGP